MSGLVVDQTKPGDARYIESSSQHQYRSFPRPGDMVLKRKYRVGGSAPRQNKHSDNQGGKTRHKLSARERELLPKQPRMVMVADVSRGAHRMMTASQFEALSWGWEIN